MLNTYLNELKVNVRLIYQFGFQGIKLPIHDIWAEIQTAGNNVDIFLVITLCSPESPEDWFKYENISERRHTKKW